MRSVVHRTGWIARGSAALAGAALLAAPAAGQPLIVPDGAVERSAGTAVAVVALEGDRAPGGHFLSLGSARIDHQGDVAFVATVSERGRQRLGLFAWLRGIVEPLAREGDPTGLGSLLVLNSFGNWAWNDGPRALFLGAADANRNGVFDAGVDPQILFMATPGRLTRLLRIGAPADGGTLLAILSVRLNSVGQVAIQAQIDRNADGRFTPGVDTAGLYLLDNGRVEPLIHEGDRVGDGRVRALGTDQPLDWQLNNRGEVVVRAGLERSPAATPVEALFLASRFDERLVARVDLRSVFGTFRRLASPALNNNGDVVFPAALRPETNAELGLFQYRSSPIVGPAAELLRPGDEAPGATVIHDILPSVTVTDDARVGFCGFYDQGTFGIAGVVPNPAACFIRSPEALFEVAREGELTPWGRVGEIEDLLLNNRMQAAVQAQVAALPFGPLREFDGAESILFWQNGTRVGLVGPGDPLAGGRVGRDASVIGLSDNGWLAFSATVTDAAGASRRGIFAARVSAG